LDQEILRRIATGHPDLQVCRDLRISQAQFDKCLDRIRLRAESVAETDNLVVYYERSLRRRAENAMRSLDARFQALLEGSPDAILVVNGTTGLIKQINTQAVAMFGYRADELIGESMEMLVPAEIRGVHPAYRIGFLASIRKREMGYHPPIMGLRADGTHVKIAVSLTATTADDDVMVVCSEYARWEAAKQLVDPEAVVNRT
jgi:PAS domain S-box-containing protein